MKTIHITQEMFLLHFKNFATFSSMCESDIVIYKYYMYAHSPHEHLYTHPFMQSSNQPIIWWGGKEGWTYSFKE